MRQVGLDTHFPTVRLLIRHIMFLNILTEKIRSFIHINVNVNSKNVLSHKCTVYTHIQLNFNILNNNVSNTIELQRDFGAPVYNTYIFNKYFLSYYLEGFFFLSSYMQFKITRFDCIYTNPIDISIRYFMLQAKLLSHNTPQFLEHHFC